MNSERYNPYEDPSLHENQPVTKPQPIDERCGFNDVMEYYDIVNGHQMPKRMDHLPRIVRGVFKWVVILMVSSFLVFQVLTILEIVGMIK